MKIAIVTDSTAYLPPATLKEYNIYTTSLNVVFEDEAFKEGIDLSTEAFYEKVRDSKELPTTSQPAIGEMIQLYEELSKDYDVVISIHLSEKFSGTFRAAQTANELVEGIEVYAVDSGISTMAQGFQVVEAAKMAREGKSVEAIIQRLELMRENTRAYFMVADLSHLQRGGRLSGAQALVGSLLNIKPVLHITEGLILPFEKIRSKKKALKRLLNLLDEDTQNKSVKEVVFIHANNEEGAQELKQIYEEKYPHIKTHLSYFGPVIGTHLGEGSLGIAWYYDA